MSEAELNAALAEVKRLRKNIAEIASMCVLDAGEGPYGDSTVSSAHEMLCNLIGIEPASDPRQPWFAPGLTVHFHTGYAAHDQERKTPCDKTWREAGFSTDDMEHVTCPQCFFDCWLRKAFAGNMVVQDDSRQGEPGVVTPSMVSDELVKAKEALEARLLDQMSKRGW